MEHYKAAVDELLARGRAYPCFCPNERLDRLREAATRKGEAFVYDGACRKLRPDEVQARVARGEPHAIRFRIEPGSRTEFEDLIGGPRSFENDRLGDFVIRRTDGWPIYHLTVVVDDHEMKISHVIRGDDHLSNTPRQILIFEALGWEVPAYGHLPLIQGADRQRLSKRHGATSVMDFAAEGFLPEAMFNFLSLLGWSLDAETEIIPRDKLIANFSLDRINASAAIFDRVKLEWMNGMYMRSLPLDQLTRRARTFFLAAGIAEHFLADPWFQSIVALEVERSRTLDEMRRNLSYFFVEAITDYDEKGAQKHFLPAGSETLLEKLEAGIAATQPFEAATLESALRALAEGSGLKFGNVVHPLRLALTGRTASPGIFDVLIALGRERSLRRISEARKWIGLRRSAPQPAEGPSA